jgi:hypothetical protein
VSDAAIILRSIAGDAASKAATKVQPTDDQLSQIDRPADDNVWHDTPGLKDVKGQVREKYQANKPFGKKDLERAAGDATEAAHPDGSRDPTDVAGKVADDQQYGTSSGVNATGGVSAGLNTLKAQAKENVPDETLEQKDKATNKTKEYNERTKSYLKGKMPQERREQTIWRLKKLVSLALTVNTDQDVLTFRRLLKFRATLITSVPSRLFFALPKNTLATLSPSRLVAKTQSKVHTLTTVWRLLRLTSRYFDTDLHNKSQPALTPFKTVLERFANGTSSAPFFDALNQIYTDADNDAELKNWFRSINQYIRKALQEQGFILTENADTEAKQLRDQGDYLLRNKYRSHTDRILDEIKFFGLQFDEDPQNKAFGKAVQKLFLDLGNDENGKPTLKPHLWKDVTEVIIPSILENFNYIPLPRIEYSDPQVDLIIENL